MPLRISVYDSPALQATILALKGFDRDLQREIRARTKTMAAPEWTRAVAENVRSRMDTRVLSDTARVQVSNQNVTLRSAGVGRALHKGGPKPADIYAAIEFGADRNTTRGIEATSRKGKKYTYTRHTTRQLQPVKRQGYAVYPAAADIIPRLAALWAQTLVRTFNETLEKGEQ